MREKRSPNCADDARVRGGVRQVRSIISAMGQAARPPRVTRLQTRWSDDVRAVTCSCRVAKDESKLARASSSAG